MPSPTPDFRFQSGDRVIVVGTDEGVRAVSSLLNAG
ncbi:MAG: cation:proton antiporter regulatory subunit [Nocardioidaceae bacterium]